MENQLNNIDTMSSLEIAKLTGKQHKNIIRDIKNMLNELDLDGSNLSHEYYQVHTDNRGYTSSINLDKELTLTLVSGYNVKMRNSIIKRWQELESNQTPKTYIEALKQLVKSETIKERALAVAEEKRIQLDESKEWYTIKRVAYANGIDWKDLEWRPLKASGDKPCKKVFDANFPNGVNAYHKSAWMAVYPYLELPASDYDENTALLISVPR